MQPARCMHTHPLKGCPIDLRWSAARWLAQPQPPEVPAQGPAAVSLAAGGPPQPTLQAPGRAPGPCSPQPQQVLWRPVADLSE